MQAYQKLKQKKDQGNKGLILAANEDATTNKMNYFLFSQQVSALCSQLDETGITSIEGVK
jgi:hypothetical protein